MPNTHYISEWALLLVGIVAGIVRALHRCIKHCTKLEVISDVLTSGFTGLLAFHACMYVGLNYDATAFVIGTAGHQGTRFLWKLVDRMKAMSISQKDTL